MTESLYERLGATAGITQLANDLVDLHMANPAISPRFTKSDPVKMKMVQLHFSLQVLVVLRYMKARVCWLRTGE